MKTSEKFPYQIDNGAVVDFVDGRFLFALKDDVWSDEELALLNFPMKIYFCYTNDLALFVMEGGPIDSGDFYFNIQECDEKEDLLSKDQFDAEVCFINGTNDIVWKKKASFSKADSQAIGQALKAQSQVDFMPGEYDVNVEGIQSAYQPYDLIKFKKAELKL